MRWHIRTTDNSEYEPFIELLWRHDNPIQAKEKETRQRKRLVEHTNNDTVTALPKSSSGGDINRIVHASWIEKRVLIRSVVRCACRYKFLIIAPEAAKAVLSLPFAPFWVTWWPPVGMKVRMFDRDYHFHPSQDP